MQKEFAARRARLLQAIGKGNMGMLSAAPEQLRNGDGHYPYRQDSYFYYMTGFCEPEAVAVFIPGRAEGEYVLFNRPLDRKQEIWTGERVGQERACKEYGANQAFPIQEWVMKLLELQQGRRVVDLKPLIAEMRLYKSPIEIEAMRLAAKISSDGHRRAMQVCRPGLREYQLEAELLYEFTRQGSRYPAYPSIVAGGRNACTLHYHENTAELRDGELVLIDAGCEYGHYASDITRTFPVNGRFSEHQRALYELVLKAQSAAIEEIRPGTLYPVMQETVVQVMTTGLVDLGILQGSVEDLIKRKAYTDVYMHGAGHWIGLDVHDVGGYKLPNGESRVLESGMTLTIEPGIYIAANSPGIDPCWWDIGIRIEDDVLVTEQGNEVLSGDLLKTIPEIEALVGSANDV